MSTSGLSHGVEVVLTAHTSSKPIWLKQEQLAQLKRLRTKIRTVMDVQGWIETFKEREDPDDNTFSLNYKQANKEASNLDKQFKAACNELVDACIEEGLDKEFLDNVISFSKKVASKKDL